MTVPKLRFKEFGGDLKSVILGDIASKVGSGSTPRGGSEAYVDSGIIFIRSQNVNQNKLLLDDVVYIPEETHEKMSGSKVFANDILLNITGASIGRTCLVPTEFDEANVNQHVCIIRTPNDNPKFIQSFLSSDKGQNLVDSHQSGGGREGLNFQSIRRFKLCVPSKEEQAKIASFFSAVDEKISQFTQKHRLLCEYKQGMMQKLFSQQIRFKADDGSEFGEWELQNLSKLSTKIGDGIHATPIYSEKGEIPFINGNNLINKKVQINENTKKITYDEFKKYNQYLTSNSILMSINGTIGNIAFYNNEICLLGKSVCFISIKEKINKNFIYFLLGSPVLVKGFKSELTGTTIKNLSLTTIRNMDFLCPCLEEQIKIANFLSAIDQKIEVVAQQIEQAKTWKKGLLQQMFV